MAGASSPVPCDGCTLCCRGQKVFLFPGEDANGLETTVDFTPEVFGNPSRRAFRLPLTPGGDCVYLGPQGCTVYDRRPRTCREFDCREHYFLPSAERRRREAVLGPHDMDIVRRGRKLVEESRR